MTPTQKDRELTRLAGKLLDGSMTNKERSEYQYLQISRMNDICRLPNISARRRKEKWLNFNK